MSVPFEVNNQALASDITSLLFGLSHYNGKNGVNEIRINNYLTVLSSLAAPFASTFPLVAGLQIRRGQCGIPINSSGNPPLGQLTLSSRGNILEFPGSEIRWVFDVFGRLRGNSR